MIKHSDIFRYCSASILLCQYIALPVYCCASILLCQYSGFCTHKDLINAQKYNIFKLFLCQNIMIFYTLNFYFNNNVKNFRSVTYCFIFHFVNIIFYFPLFIQYQPLHFMKKNVVSILFNLFRYLN